MERSSLTTSPNIAKSYAERLFRYPEVGQLSRRDAAAAIEVPLRDNGLHIHPDALDWIRKAEKKSG